MCLYPLGKVWKDVYYIVNDAQLWGTTLIWEMFHREEVRDSFDYQSYIFKSSCYALGSTLYKTLYSQLFTSACTI